MQKIAGFVAAVAFGSTKLRVLASTRLLALAGGVLLALASGAAAHPGHGLGGGSNDVLHHLSDPLHLAPWALAVLTLALRRRRSRTRTRG
jgi:hypothetical protein